MIERGTVADQMLRALAEAPGSSNRDLSVLLEVTEPQLSRAGRRLIELGLAHPERVGRTNEWRLTPLGLDLVGGSPRVGAVRFVGEGLDAAQLELVQGSGASLGAVHGASVRADVGWQRVASASHLEPELIDLPLDLGLRRQLGGARAVGPNLVVEPEGAPGGPCTVRLTVGVVDVERIDGELVAVTPDGKSHRFRYEPARRDLIARLPVRTSPDAEEQRLSVRFDLRATSG